MMQRDQWNRMKELFARADELSPDERPAYLAGACGDDAGLRQKVEALLAAAPSDHEDEPRGPRTPRDEGGEPHLLPPGTRVGGFTVVGPIGVGGMGAVYRAEQDKPRRAVALKLIRPGLVSRATLQRFEFEAEVLARLEHPGIARVYEAGTADLGAGPQPFFAMELIEGHALDHHLAAVAPPLRPRQRVELLLRICQAVEHAHGRGIVHRDLKPENILVTADGQPKVLDFGVARAVDADVRAATLHTQTGQVLGTVPYMAPEQVRGRVNELDAATDVYALGVIGYELLSGRMPYPVKDAALPEAARVICEHEPSRLSSIDKGLRGDVETIIGKAMEKDKARRYPAAGALAADLRRYLDYEPITARPPGTWYQLARFARRNRALVGGAAAVVLSLVGGLVGIATFAIRAEVQRREAEAARDSLQVVNRFLTHDVIRSADPSNLGRQVTVREAIDHAAATVNDRFSEKPLIAAAIHDAIARTYDALGHSDLGLPNARAALEARRRLLGAEHPDTLMAAANLAMLLGKQASYAESVSVCRGALQSARRALEPDHPATRELVTTLASLLQDAGQLAEAEPLFREAFQRDRRVLGVRDERTIASMNNLALLLQKQGRLSEAEPLFSEGLQASRLASRDDRPATLDIMNNMALLLQQEGKLQAAESLFRDALERSRRVRGSDHPRTLNLTNNLGFALASQGKLADAQPLYREAHELRRRRLGDDHPDTLMSLSNLGTLLLRRGDLDEAEPILRHVLERYRRVFGNDHPQVLVALNNLAAVLRDRGRAAEAEPLYREALERRRRTLGNDHPDTLVSIYNLGRLLQASHKLEEAERLCEELYQGAQGAQMSPQFAALFSAPYGVCLAQMSRYDPAEGPLLEAQRRLRATGQASHPRMREVLAALADVYEHTNRPDEAASCRGELATLAAATTHPTTRTIGTH